MKTMTYSQPLWLLRELLRSSCSGNRDVTSASALWLCGIGARSTAHSNSNICVALPLQVAPPAFPPAELKSTHSCFQLRITAGSTANCQISYLLSTAALLLAASSCYCHYHRLRAAGPAHQGPFPQIGVYAGPPSNLVIGN
jgi:hypothetical protein